MSGYRPFGSPVLPAPLVCNKCGRKNRRYTTRDNGSGKRYYNLVCSACRSSERHQQRRRILAEMDPDKAYRISRHEQLITKYKLSLEAYEALFKSQGYGCAICSGDDRKDRRYLNMPVDHDHVTGKVRGILCNNCNRLLGKAHDSPEILRKAIDYLKNYGNI